MNGQLDLYTPPSPPPTPQQSLEGVIGGVGGVLESPCLSVLLSVCTCVLALSRRHLKHPVFL